MSDSEQDAGAPKDGAATRVADAPAAPAGDLSSAPTPGRKPVVQAASALEEAIVRGVENWAAAHFYSTPVSQATKALNYLRHVAVPDLVSKILKEI